MPMVPPFVDVVAARTRSLFSLVIRMWVACVLLSLSAFAAPPSAEVDAKIVGRWHVSPPGLERVYEISTGRNVKIVGGDVKEKFCHLQPQEDGSYRMSVDVKSLAKIVYVAANDQLQIEFYKTKKDLDLGIALWKSAGIRLEQK